MGGTASGSPLAALGMLKYQPVQNVVGLPLQWDVRVVEDQGKTNRVLGNMGPVELGRNCIRTGLGELAGDLGSVGECRCGYRLSPGPVGPFFPCPSAEPAANANSIAEMAKCLRDSHGLISFRHIRISGLRLWLRRAFERRYDFCRRY